MFDGLIANLIGSSVRHFAMTSLVNLFLENNQECQIVSLGAGSDTRAFSLLAKYNRGKNSANKKILYHELDFDVMTKKKAQTIHGTPLLSNVIYGDGNSPTQGATQLQPTEIHTPDYHLHACDLRTLSESSDLLQGMTSTLPTLVISECCLCYLQPEESDKVFAWLVRHFQATGLGVVLYEPIGGGDAFGEVMIENLASRGISLPTLKKYPTLKSEVSRLVDRGLAAAVVVADVVDERPAHGDSGRLAAACDMWYMYKYWISEAERARTAKLEFLDEIEELSLLLKHYCVAWTIVNGSEKWVKACAKLPSQIVG